MELQKHKHPQLWLLQARSGFATCLAWQVGLVAGELLGHHLPGDGRCWLHGGTQASPVQGPG